MSLTWIVTTNLGLAQQGQTGLTIEVQVVPQAILQISSVGQQSNLQGGINLDFGEMDAFGQHRSPGILVQRVKDGAIYYHPIIVHAGTSGGTNYRGNLKVALNPGSNNSHLEFIELAGRYEVPTSVPNSINLGEVRTIASNISKAEGHERLVGIFIHHNTPGGNITAQMEYSLEVGP